MTAIITRDNPPADNGTSSTSATALTHSQLNNNFFPIYLGTDGTVEAGKAIIVDSNKDFTGARNGTITGALTAVTLTASGTVNAGDLAATGTVALGSGATDSLALNFDSGITYIAAATWSFVAPQTVSGTWSDLGTVTTADINGGTWQGTIDGAWSAAGQTCADLGTVSAATSITSGSFIGPLIGSATGSASTVTANAQPAITSVGTLTNLDVDNININGNTISSTAGTDLIITPLGGQQVVIDTDTIIDGGTVTSPIFAGNLTGNANSATVATVANSATLAGTVTVAATTNTSASVLLAESASGSLGVKSAVGLTFNALTSSLTVTGSITAAALSLATPIGVPVGGTGRSSNTAYSIICGGTTSTSLQQSVASVGTSGQYLKSEGAGTLPTWADLPTGSGDVTAAAALGDNLLIRGDVPTKGVQNSGITINDADDMSGIGVVSATSMTATGFISSGSGFIGNITGNAGSATVSLTSTVTDESTDTACNVLFTTVATGNLALHTGTNLTFNSSSGALTASSFVGSLTGNADSATVATNLSVATTSDTSTSVLLSPDLSGTIAPKTDSALYYNASTGQLNSGSLVLASDLSVQNGGTGVSTLTNHGVLIGNADSDITVSAVGATGKALSGNTGSDPTWKDNMIGCMSGKMSGSMAGSSTYYGGFAGDNVLTTEGTFRVPMPFSGTITSFRTYIDTNVLNGTADITLRDTASDTALTIHYNALESGTKSVGGAVGVSANDHVSVKVVTGAGAGLLANITYSFSIRAG